MKNKISITIILLFFNIMYAVYATNSYMDVNMFTVLLMEAFITIHMSIFVLYPLSNIFSKGDSKKQFWNFFFIRVYLLLILNMFIPRIISSIDFILVFAGAFLIVPILSIINKKNPFKSSNDITIKTDSTNKNDLIIKCSNCGAVLNITDKVCPKCKTPFEGSNVVVEEDTSKIVKPKDFDPMYNKSEDELLNDFIIKELKKAGIDNNKLLPKKILMRKNILSFIFSLLVLVYTFLIFFHFPKYTYVIGTIILIIFFILKGKYSFIKYLKKEIKSRPKEKISNIVMSTKSSFTYDKYKIVRFVSVIIAILLPIYICRKPIILYEKVEGGYAVRYYLYGFLNDTEAIIPEMHNGKPVVSLRGNTFSNMSNLKKVVLPDTIIEIRGQAFKNDTELVSVNMPKKLEYLGGSAFYNCKSLESIFLPDSLTYLGGNAFYNAHSLKSVRLSHKLQEIRGNTFEFCDSLVRIEIPDSVTRIGGHAFYGNSTLKEVIISKNSQLKEIGSSAFRRCYNLDSITIPRDTLVNFRAFKESPTQINYY